MKAFILMITLILGQLCYPNNENDSIPKAEVATTMQSVTINGNTIYLTAKTGTFELKDETNKPIALMGFTYYTRDSKRGLATQRRPIVLSLIHI